MRATTTCVQVCHIVWMQWKLCGCACDRGNTLHLHVCGCACHRDLIRARRSWAQKGMSFGSKLTPLHSPRHPQGILHLSLSACCLCGSF